MTGFWLRRLGGGWPDAAQSRRGVALRRQAARRSPRSRPCSSISRSTWRSRLEMPARCAWAWAAEPSRESFRASRS